MSRLHWHAPGPRRAHWSDPPSRWNRYRLGILEEHWRPGAGYGRDRHGPYTWMPADCGWQWLETRPGVRFVPPLGWAFGRLHEHVHRPVRGSVGGDRGGDAEGDDCAGGGGG